MLLDLNLHLPDIKLVHLGPQDHLFDQRVGVLQERSSKVASPAADPSEIIACTVGEHSTGQICGVHPKLFCLEQSVAERPISSCNHENQVSVAPAVLSLLSRDTLLDLAEELAALDPGGLVDKVKDVQLGLDTVHQG
jgi:hypothetical protein